MDKCILNNRFVRARTYPSLEKVVLLNNTTNNVLVMIFTHEVLGKSKQKDYFKVNQPYFDIFVKNIYC